MCAFTEDRDDRWFLIDLSPSMDFGSKEQRKRDVAARFVSILARLLTGHGNVGALLHGSGVRHGAARPQVASRCCSDAHPAAQPPTPTWRSSRPPVPTRLNELLQSAGSRAPPVHAVCGVRTSSAKPVKAALGQLAPAS
jgi:uncharacterized protein (DUF58 family)